MNDERHDLNEILRMHGSPPGHLPGFEARLLAGLDEADREMGRATGGWLRWPRGSRSLWSRHPVLASVAAVGIVAAVATAVLVGVPGLSRLSGPQPVSAAQVIQKALDALSSGKTMQADATVKEEASMWVPEYSVTHSRVLLRSDGSFRQTQTDRPQTSKPEQMRDRADAADTAYDAASGVFRDYSRGWDWDAGGYVNRVEVTTGYPLGPPDRWANEQFDISATARALQADGAATLETASYDGRPVWVVSGSKRAAASGLSDDETYSITIDQQTCLPTRVQMFSVGVLQLDYSLHNVRVDEPLPDTAFTFAPPKGAKVVRSDAGFRRLPLARIGSTRGPRHAAADLAPGRLCAEVDRGRGEIDQRERRDRGAGRGRPAVRARVRRLDRDDPHRSRPARRRDDRPCGARHVLGRPRQPRCQAHGRRLRRRHRTGRRGVVHHHPPPLRGQERRLADRGRRRDGQGADRDRRVAAALPKGEVMKGHRRSSDVKAAIMLALLVVVATIALAACGGSPKSGSTASRTTPSATASPATAPTAASDPTQAARTESVVTALMTAWNTAWSAKKDRRAHLSLYSDDVQYYDAAAIDTVITKSDMDAMNRDPDWWKSFRVTLRSSFVSADGRFAATLGKIAYRDASGDLPWQPAASVLAVANHKILWECDYYGGEPGKATQTEPMLTIARSAIAPGSPAAKTAIAEATATITSGLRPSTAGTPRPFCRSMPRMPSTSTSSAPGGGS